jgi:hypothetical protein
MQIAWHRLVTPQAQSSSGHAARLRAALRTERGGASAARLEDGAIKIELLDRVIRRVQADVRAMCRKAAIWRRSSASAGALRPSSNEAVVLDASAVRALMPAKPGRDAVAAVLPGALRSSVNPVEVVSKLDARGMAGTQAHADALALVSTSWRPSATLRWTRERSAR